MEGGGGCSREPPLVAPENFSLVEEGVYRSSFPREANFSFLSHLGLKSVLALVPEKYPAELCSFYDSIGIRLLVHGTDGNKWPHKEINKEAFKSAIRAVLDPSNRPLLIHCNKGKHRTGCIVGVLRKIRRWSMSAICAEYVSFWPTTKSRLEDQLMIESFDVREFVADAASFSSSGSSSSGSSSSSGDDGQIGTDAAASANEATGLAHQRNDVEASLVAGVESAHITSSAVFEEAAAPPPPPPP